MDESNECKIKNFEFKIDNSFFVELYKRRLRSYKSNEVSIGITANITNGILHISEASFQNTFNCIGFLVCFNTFSDFNDNNDLEFIDSKHGILTSSLDLNLNNDNLNHYCNISSRFAIFTYVDLVKLVCHYRISPLANFDSIGYTLIPSDVTITGVDKFFGFEKIFILRDDKIESLNALNSLNNKSQLNKINLIVISDVETIDSTSLHFVNFISYLCNRYDMREIDLYFPTKNGIYSERMRVTHSKKWRLYDSTISGTHTLRNDGIDINDIASTLHFELAMWRIVPELDPDKMGNLSIAILGMGTLGCSIATQIINWGIRNITIVDSGRVSHFNIGRQSLYTLEDAKNCKYKVQAARDNLLLLYPDLNIKSHNLDIPMLGHSIYLDDIDKLKSSVDLLNEITSVNDVIFMVTDTRESRWLPTLLISHRNWINRSIDLNNNITLGIVASLGFDSCLVSRQSYNDFNGSCYFCGDFVAPTNTKIKGLSDEICTVTRPGIAPICSSLAVELLATISQTRSFTNGKSCLGSTPQTIRFNLSDYSIFTYNNEKNPKCICCSDLVIEAYDEGRLDFLKQVIARPDLLVALTHLDQLNVNEDVITL